jgi:hypothetical protein
MEEKYRALKHSKWVVNTVRIMVVLGVLFSIGLLMRREKFTPTTIATPLTSVPRIKAEEVSGQISERIFAIQSSRVLDRSGCSESPLRAEVRKDVLIIKPFSGSTADINVIIQRTPTRHIECQHLEDSNLIENSIIWVRCAEFPQIIYNVAALPLSVGLIVREIVFPPETKKVGMVVDNSLDHDIELFLDSNRSVVISKRTQKMIRFYSGTRGFQIKKPSGEVIDSFAVDFAPFMSLDVDIIYNVGGNNSYTIQQVSYSVQ